MSRSAGFSLIELLIALVVMGIVLALSLPPFNDYRNAMALKQVNGQLLQDVRRARQLAVVRHATVVMVFGGKGAAKNTYTTHVDTNGDNVRQSNEMMTRRSLPRGCKLHKVNLSPTDSLTFDISGVLRSTVPVGTLGGNIVFMNAVGAKDTLMVSTAGVCYRP